MRYFPLMLYASVENRDWGVGRIELRSSSSSSTRKSTVRGSSIQSPALKALTVMLFATQMKQLIGQDAFND
jgi:hypothetical protein